MNSQLGQVLSSLRKIIENERSKADAIDGEVIGPAVESKGGSGYEKERGIW